MSILNTTVNCPKRIGDYVIYTSRGQTIFRSISRFTSKTLKSDDRSKVVMMLKVL